MAPWVNKHAQHTHTSSTDDTEEGHFFHLLHITSNSCSVCVTPHFGHPSMSTPFTLNMHVFRTVGWNHLCLLNVFCISESCGVEEALALAASLLSRSNHCWHAAALPAEPLLPLWPILFYKGVTKISNGRSWERNLCEEKATLSPLCNSRRHAMMCTEADKSGKLISTLLEYCSTSLDYSLSLAVTVLHIISVITSGSLCWMWLSLTSSHKWLVWTLSK